MKISMRRSSFLFPRLEIFIILSETPKMSSTTNDNRCAKFSETLGDTMNSKGKIEKMDAEIAKLNETIIFFKMMVEMKDEGTTKKGRVIDNINNNKAIVSAIRDVMNVSIFPYCKFLGKKDLQTIARGSVGEAVLNALNIGTEHEGNGGVQRIDLFKKRLAWWIRNVELVEKQLVEHRTKVTQNVKHRYIQGKH